MLIRCTNLVLVNVQANDPFVDRSDFHATLLEQKHYHQNRAVAKGAAIQRPVEVRRLFLTCAVHGLCRSCQAIRGTSEWRRVELAFAVAAIKGFHDLGPTRRHTHSFFHHQGCRLPAGMKVSADVKPRNFADGLSWGENGGFPGSPWVVVP